MGALEIIEQILAGGLLGMLGQGLRAVAGMKKVNDAAVGSGQQFGDLFNASRFMVSMFIGFTAGALALFGVGLSAKGLIVDKSTMSAIIAAGYAGTDFIQAFITKQPSVQAPAAAKGATSGVPPVG